MSEWVQASNRRELETRLTIYRRLSFEEPELEMTAAEAGHR